MKRAADKSIEYVLAYNFPPYAKTLAEVLVPVDTVVTNVCYVVATSTLLSKGILGGSTQLQFTVKETGKQYYTNYGYMFVRATPENLAALAKYRAAKLQVESYEKAANKLYEQVETIAGPFEGVFSNK